MQTNSRELPPKKKRVSTPDMHPYRDSWITRTALILFFLIIIVYAYFEGRGILFGPTINIGQSIQEVSNPYVEITGTTSHISELTMNGAIVPVTETGAFDVPYVLTPGDNRLVFDAKDKYGQATERVVEIVYTSTSTPAASIKPINSTSTASTSSTSTLAH